MESHFWRNQNYCSCNIIYLSLIGRIVHFWQMLLTVIKAMMEIFQKSSLGNNVQVCSLPLVSLILPRSDEYYKLKQKNSSESQKKKLCIFDQPFYRIVFGWRIFQHLQKKNHKKIFLWCFMLAVVGSLRTILAIFYYYF